MRNKCAARMRSAVAAAVQTATRAKCNAAEGGKGLVFHASSASYALAGRAVYLSQDLAWETVGRRFCCFRIKTARHKLPCRCRLWMVGLATRHTALPPVNGGMVHPQHRLAACEWWGGPPSTPRCRLGMVGQATRKTASPPVNGRVGQPQRRLAACEWRDGPPAAPPWRL